MVEVMVAIGAVLAVALAEAIHVYRCSRVARLAFGPSGRPSTLGFIAPILRPAAAGLLAWGLMTLLLIEPRVITNGADRKLAPNEVRHLVLLLDVSPSMRLDDAGASRQIRRIERAAELMESFFERVPLEQYRISVIAVYNGSKPVVVDTSDVEVVRNILRDLPMHYAFNAGKTDLFSGFEVAADMAKPWRPNSTTLMMVSDGDTVPGTGMPALPVSIQDVVVVGVGDPRQGKFIDGKQSKQDTSTLRQIATRLQGTYHNGNEKHLTTNLIQSLGADDDSNPFTSLGKREYAMWSCGIGASLLATLPLLLHFFGTFWVPGIRGPIRPKEGLGKIGA